MRTQVTPIVSNYGKLLTKWHLSISQHNVKAWFMYVWVKPDTVITIREEDGQPISRVLQFRSLDILLQRSLFCIRQPQSQSYEDLGTLDMNLEYTRATKANTDQVNICKYKIGDQLSLSITGTYWNHTGTVFSWGRWTRDVKGDFSLAKANRQATALPAALAALDQTRFKYKTVTTPLDE